MTLSTEPQDWLHDYPAVRKPERMLQVVAGAIAYFLLVVMFTSIVGSVSTAATTLRVFLFLNVVFAIAIVLGLLAERYNRAVTQICPMCHQETVPGNPRCLCGWEPPVRAKEKS